MEDSTVSVAAAGFAVGGSIECFIKTQGTATARQNKDEIQDPGGLAEDQPFCRTLSQEGQTSAAQVNNMFDPRVLH